MVDTNSAISSFSVQTLKQDAAEIPLLCSTLMLLWQTELFEVRVRTRDGNSKVSVFWGTFQITIFFSINVYQMRWNI